MAKILHGIAEVADSLGVSSFTLRRRIRAGEISTVNIGARRLIHESELQRIVSSGVGQPRKSHTEKTA